MGTIRCTSDSGVIGWEFGHSKIEGFPAVSTAVGSDSVVVRVWVRTSCILGQYVVLHPLFEFGPWYPTVA